MRDAHIQQLPIVDDENRVLEVVFLRSLTADRQFPNLVVLMAGGLGTRLLPLTETVPKPLIQIGGKPILQNIIEAFVAQGFFRFAISVGHLGHQIESFIGDGSEYDAEVTYLRETKRLGTAGALSLLQVPPEDAFFVMNGDVLTSTNFAAMLRFHNEALAAATMGVNHFRYKVPYGVIDLIGDRIVEIREKPHYEFFVNAGIYVLSPKTLDYVPADEYFDMTSLFSRLVHEQEKAAAFPIFETWFDIGHPHDLTRAEEAYKTFPRGGESGNVQA
jgi:NDP-sugar pyrophosphorylase family protein